MNKSQQYFNRLFRHQVYLEGVTAYYHNEFRKRLRQLTLALAGILVRSRIGNLGSISKTQLNNILRQLQVEQNKIIGSFDETLIQTCNDLARAENEIASKLFDTDKSDDDKLWASITNEPIPASGSYLEDHATQFFKLVMLGTLASIRRGYANNWTMQQVMNFITGSSIDTFAGGLFAKYLAQELTLTATLFQHVSSIVQADVASGTTNKYEWVSILDNRTTVICWNRNGTIYVYGEGPLPPAHWNCRSKTIPYFGESVQVPSSYYSWLKDQPAVFQNDALGESVASKLRSGELTANDFAKISTKTPLSLQDFLSKIQYMIGE